MQAIRPSSERPKPWLGPLFLLALATSACGPSVGSLGAVLAQDNETHALHVRDVPPGLAAAEAGIRAGDEILMIEGVYVRSLDAAQIRALLRGEPGASVAVTIARGDELIRLEVKRTVLIALPGARPREEILRE